MTNQTQHLLLRLQVFSTILNDKTNQNMNRCSLEEHILYSNIRCQESKVFHRHMLR